MNRIDSQENQERTARALLELTACGTDIIDAIHCGKVVFKITVYHADFPEFGTVNFNFEVPSTTSGGGPPESGGQRHHG